MATRLETLELALARVDAKIAELMLSYGPDYSLDGQSESINKSLLDLMTMQEKLRVQIIAEGGPVEIHSQGMT